MKHASPNPMGKTTGTQTHENTPRHGNYKQELKAETAQRLGTDEHRKPGTVTQTKSKASNHSVLTLQTRLRNLSAIFNVFLKYQPGLGPRCNAN